MGTGLFLRSAEYLYQPLPLHVISIGRFGPVPVVNRFTSGSTAFSTSAWPANNQALYYPISMPQRFTIARFMAANGSAVSGTCDVGLYNAAGSKLFSTGPTSQAGTTQIQYFGVTDQSFPPGFYYLALLCSTTSARIMAQSFANQYEVRACGVLQEAVGAATLPTTMTPVSCTTNLVFYFGFTQSDTL